MSDTAAEFAEPAPTEPEVNSWDQLLAALRARYPGQKDSILFCVWKLQNNPEASLRDFRDEAEMHGLTLVGRSVHSAKVLLGLADPLPKVVRKPRVVAEPAPVAMPKRSSAPVVGVESKLVAAVEQLQNAAAEENARLRAALQAVLDIVDDALDFEEYQI
jgi:hypothetical protein